jgi:hypothetical protein
LEKYLTKDTLVAKGSPEFFYQKYGKVDGNEIDRFAALAKWPRSAKFEHKRQQSSPDYRLYPAPSDWRKILRLAVDAWKAVLKRSIDAMKIPDPNRDEVLDNECKLALGISTDVTVEDESALLPRTQPLIVLSPEVDPLNAISVKVMSLNMWHGGEAHPAHHKLEVMAEMIVSMKADVVGLQEIAGVHPSGSNYPPTNEKADLRKCKIEEMANLIGSLASADGKPWYFINQGIVTPGKGNIQPWGIISRWPIHQTSPNKWGVLVNGPGNKRIWVFNVHLPYFPYQVRYYSYLNFHLILITHASLIS